jgi:hypothetical protein
MRYLCLLGIAAVLGPQATLGQAQRQAEAASIVGTWLLESIADTLASDSVAYWMGPHPRGAII